MAADTPSPDDTFAMGATIAPDPTDDADASAAPSATETDPLAETVLGTSAPVTTGPGTRDDALGGGALGLSPEEPDRYIEQRTLGEGGIGQVIEVFDRHLARDVALKVLRSDRGSLSASVHARFVNEARITGVLEHAGVVPVYELGRRADGRPYYTMRKIEGRTLADALQGASLNERLRLLPRFIDVCQTVAYAHEHRIIHRDLKPENVMMGPFGETLVLDWGLAKWLDRDPIALEDSLAEDPVLDLDADAFRTSEGSLLGTPAYMPPEQARGELAAIDTRSDVYTLGVILFELLCGRTPFKANSAIAMAVKVTKAPIPDPRTIEPSCPPELVAVALRALQKEPAGRYPDAQTMAKDLVAFEEGELVSAHEYGWRDLAARAWRRNKRALVVVALALALVGGVWWVRGAADARRQAARHAETQRARVFEVERLLDEIRDESEAGILGTHALRLISLQSPAVRRRLRQALSDAHPGVRRAAAHALGGIGARSSVSALVARLAPDAEDDDDVRVEIIEALAAIGDPDADEAVHEARARAGVNSELWQRTETAFRMIPPAPIGAMDRTDSAAWRKLGIRYVEKQRYAEGEFAYRQAMTLDPSDPKPPSNLAIAYRRQRRYAEAKALLEHAIKLDPSFENAPGNLAVLLRHQGAFPATLPLLDRLVAQKGRLHLSALRSRAWSRWGLGDFEGARADLDAALAIDDTSRQTLAVDGLYWAARGDWAQALVRYNQSIERDPNFALAFHQRGRIQAAAGDLEAALRDFRRAGQIDPKLPDLRADMAGLMHRMGRDRGAKRILRRAIRRTPGDARVHAALAVFGFAAKGQWAEALAALDEADRRAMPGDRALLTLLRVGVTRRAGGAVPVERLEPVGDMPWHDRLLGVVAGVEPPDALARSVYTPQMRGELALAAWLVAGEAALQALPPVSGSAAQPAPPGALAEGLLTVLRAPPP